MNESNRLSAISITGGEIVEDSVLPPLAIELMINEIIKKKKQLHHPNEQYSKRVFSETQDVLKQKGYFYSLRTLEKKFDSLKKQFYTEHREGSIKSPYNLQLLEIFGEELAIENAPTMASLYPAPPLPKSALPIVTKQTNNNSESSSEEEDDEEIYTNQVDSKDTVWKHDVILDFLDLCIGKKDDFWSPNVRRRQIFSEIRESMKAKGYKFHSDNLDIKLRNMKQRYSITRKALEKDKNKIIRWPYYQQLHELYDGFDTRPHNRSRQSLKQSDVQRDEEEICIIDEPASSNSVRFRRILPATSGVRTRTSTLKRPHSPEECTFKSEGEHNNPLLTPGEFDFCAVKPDVLHEDKEVISNDTKSDLQIMQKILDLEKRRTDVMEQLLDQVRESNAIRAKKLEFKRIKLSYYKSKGKQKEL